jgi:hypothetical protein
LCLARYIAVWVWTYAGLCRALRRHVCLRLYLDLNLNLNSRLCPPLNRALFQKLLEKPNPALFPQLYGLKYRSLLDLANLAPYRETQPPGRPLGR